MVAVEGRRVSAIEVIAGDFKPDPRSCFERAAMRLCREHRGATRLVRLTPADLTRFRVRDGAWARFFDEAGDWTRALATAALAGAPLSGVNLIAPTFFFGQQALITWANALIGSAAAAAAIKSKRMVRFEAHFGPGAVLHARVEERALMARLPHFYRALARSA